MVVYMVVTRDKYELPLFIADTAQEIADYKGVNKQSVFQQMARKNKKGRCIYVRVDIGEDEEE